MIPIPQPRPIRAFPSPYAWSPKPGTVDTPKIMVADTFEGTIIQHWQLPAPWVLVDSGLRSTPGRGLERRFRGPAWSSGSFLAIAVKSSRTLVEVFAEVSKKRRPASLAYASASAVSMARLSGNSLTTSTLFPANAMMMFSLACLWSSFTHDLALSNDD